MERDVVAEYIELKNQYKKDKEKLDAMELVIFDKFRNDKRINIVAGRKTYTIKETTYDNLESVGIKTTVTEERYKKLKEFDIETQKMILDNPENYDLKQSKESIRVKK